MLLYEIGNSWIAGSIHVLPEPTAATTERVLSALIAQVEDVVLEVDLEQAGEPPFARMPSGWSLGDVTPPDLYQATLVLGQRLGLQPQDLAGCKPWWAALRIAVHQLVAGGLSLELGVDKIAHRIANNLGKRVTLLEAPERGLQCFDQAPLPEQLGFLEFIVARQPEAAAEFGRLFRGWITGSTPLLIELLDDRFATYPQIFRCVVERRNREWLANLYAFARRRERSLAVVGALHLVGAYGLPTLLGELGCEVRRLDHET